MRSIALLVLASTLTACGEPHPNHVQAPAAPISSIAWVPTWGTSSPSSTPPPAISASPSASATPVATAFPPTPPTADPASSPQADRAVAAVLKLPGVQGMCSEVIARGASSCSAWVAQPSNGPCNNQKVAYENEDCWWTINLEEVMHYPGGDGDHANRIATFYVDPTTFTVMGVQDFACPMLFSLPAFRALQLRRSKGSKPDDCNGAVPFPMP